MPVFGKILAGFKHHRRPSAFLCLAGMEWGKRTEAQYQVFRAKVALDGLPLDAKESWLTDPDEAGEPRLSKRLIAEMFSTAQGGSTLGGDPVKTVKRRNHPAYVPWSVRWSRRPRRPRPRRAAVRGFLLDQQTDGQGPRRAGPPASTRPAPTPRPTWRTS